MEATKSMTIRLPFELYDELRLVAFSSRRHMSEIVIDSIKLKLADLKQKAEAQKAEET